jgi:hypothetical protein
MPGRSTALGLVYPVTDEVRGLLTRLNAPILASTVGDCEEYVCQWEEGTTHPVFVRLHSAGWAVWRDGATWCYGRLPVFRTPNPVALLTLDATTAEECIPRSNSGWMKVPSAYWGPETPFQSRLSFSVAEEWLSITHCESSRPSTGTPPII